MPGVRNVNVVDSVIFVYARETILNVQEGGAAWFVINAKDHKVRGFKDHQGYLDHIHSIGIDSEPELLEVREVSQYFLKHHTVSWKDIATSSKH